MKGKKSGDRFHYQGQEYFATDIKKQVIHARKIFSGDTVGIGIYSIPKNKKGKAKFLR